MSRKALENTNVLMPPGHPIKLLKSNLFNMAAVLVKRSVHQTMNISIEKTNISIENYLGQVKPQRTVKNIELNIFSFLINAKS